MVEDDKMLIIDRVAQDEADYDTLLRMTDKQEQQTPDEEDEGRHTDSKMDEAVDQV